MKKTTTKRWDRKRSILCVGFLSFAVSPFIAGLCAAQVPDRSELDKTALDQARELVSKMSLDQKTGLIDMKSLAVEEFGIPAHHWWNEALHGVGRRGKATSFPVSLCMASTWNPELINKMASAIGDEARALHHADSPGDAAKRYHGLTIWSPTINMARDPRWGRTQETYGEDPFLTGVIGKAFVTGLQGDDPNWLKTVATVKHFVANNREKSRTRARPNISERALREYYFPAFRTAVEEGGVESIMVAYNGINGIPCGANRWLLTDVLRKEWGFRGTVVTDVGVPSFLYSSHRFVKDREAASAAMFNAGVDIACDRNRKSPVADARAAFQSGFLRLSKIDRAAAQGLATRIKLGLLRPEENDPYANISTNVVGCSDHLALARKIASDGMILLKNEGSVLPATPEKYDRIVLAGPRMNDASLGIYSGTPTHPPVSAATGLSELLSGEYDVQSPFSGSWQPVPAENFHLEGDASTAGLKAEYFPNLNLSGKPKTVRIDPAVDFNWPRPLSHVDPDIPQPSFSVRWSGELVPSRTGPHVFSIEACQGARMFLDDRKILDIWGSHADSSAMSTAVELTAGKPAKIRVEYFDAQAEPATRIRLSWIQPPEKKVVGNPARELLVYVGGMHPEKAAEARDFADLDLPPEQIEEIRELSTIYPHMVLVINDASTPELGELTQVVPAILLEWLAGQQGGYALADLIGGRVNPAGRLPLTYYADMKKLPNIQDYEISKGRTYMYAKDNVAYPFGHGLSYSSFRYGNIAVSQSECSADDELLITLDVSNTSARDGDEVVQLYVSNIESKVYQPLKQLKAFERIHVPAGKTVKVSLPLNIRSLSWWDENNDGFVLDKGRYRLNIGASSSDIRLTKEIDVK